MNTKNQFGGKWTQRKLDALKKYLQAYLTALKSTPFKLYYIDAFAGPGVWENKQQLQQSRIFKVEDESEESEYKQGSPFIALGMQNPRFHQFVFIDNNRKYVNALERHIAKHHPHKQKNVECRCDDANLVVRKLCQKWDKKGSRAVIFLDPFGMEVEWQTIEAIANTQSMDLWVLFPLGMGVNRMLKRDGEIQQNWQDKLDILFGTSDWRDKFYQPAAHQQSSLFNGDGGGKYIEKIAHFEAIAAYFVERLKTVFPPDGVVDNPLILENSRSNPMFALCFAASNPKGAKIAKRIAKHIIDTKQ